MRLLVFILLLLPRLLSAAPLCEFTKPPAGASEEEIRRALDYLNNVCLPKVARVNECTYRLDAIASEINGYRQTFFDDRSDTPLVIEALKSSPAPERMNYDVYRNFSHLKAKHSEGIALIQSFIDGHLSQEKTGLENHDAIKELDRGYLKMADDVVKLTLSESIFLKVIDETQTRMKQRYELQKDEINWLMSVNCQDADIDPALAVLDTTRITMTTQLMQIKRYILEVRKSRQNLIRFAYESIRQKWSNAPSQYYLDELSETRSKIRAILHVNDLANAYELWWLNAYTDWDRNNLYQVYIQYEKPLALYKSDIAKAYGFKAQIELAAADYPEVAEAFLDHLVTRIIPVAHRRAERLEAMGWEGVLGRQKLLAQRRIEHGTYSEECAKHMQNYLEQSEKVTGLPGFRVIETIYRKGVEQCRSSN
ncbi:hypothetical protein [Pseudobacteriovorax antillogorgiicola]|uniref:Uncharacterized protein n=1 Tax=Pseudobacteriovorax antillogorgiicola TaxID=1513793 RepID=A0A1Y6BPW7_9BACT|nr:hypothetical protein [Pseudobacteriovorax antillogorgiicola]TCS53706.1 hypothetical protein EDD56_10715 [Pseudobacteriovorax antillogorgiicola]SMF22975.1 hypothetical protein SAMN06296036_107257 [Pseudobacteriovorax antillogorgiicola]